MVCNSGGFVLRHQGQVVASHPAVADCAQLSAQPAHGTRAVAPHLRHRYTSPVEVAHEPPHQRDVEIRDLSVYEQLLDLQEVDVMAAKADTRLDTPSPMSSPAQLERLSEHLRKLRLLKSGERLEEMLRHAASHEQPNAGFL